MRNYYDILGVKADAGYEKIKSAYRNLAKKYHPDTAAACSDNFILIKEAFDTLSDNASRRQYDRSLGIHRPFNTTFSSDRVYVPPVTQDVFDDLMDVFLDKFHLPVKKNLNFDLFLSDHEFTNGANTVISIPQEKICPGCFGFGGTILSTCKTCGGSGLVSYDIDFDLYMKPPLVPGQVYELNKNNYLLRFELKRRI